MTLTFDDVDDVIHVNSSPGDLRRLDKGQTKPFTTITTTLYLHVHISTINIHSITSLQLISFYQPTPPLRPPCPPNTNTSSISYRPNSSPPSLPNSTKVKPVGSVFSGDQESRSSQDSRIFTHVGLRADSGWTLGFSYTGAPFFSSMGALRFVSPPQPPSVLTSRSYANKCSSNVVGSRLGACHLRTQSRSGDQDVFPWYVS